MSTPGQSSDPVRRRPRWPFVAGGIAVAVVISGLSVIYFRSAPIPPKVDLTGVDPAVQRAIRKASDEVRRQPRSAESWGKLGMVLQNHVFADPALTCYQEAERLDVADLRWPYFQGLIVMSYDPPAAVPKLEQAARLAEGKSERVRLRLAELYLQLARCNDAKKEFEAVLEMVPGHPRASLGLARVHFQADELDQSRARLRPALAHPLTRLSALRLSAEIYQRQGDAKNAHRELAHALALADEPEWPDVILAELDDKAIGESARLKRAGRLLDERKLLQAAQALQEVVHDYPKSEKAWLLHGYALLNLGWLPQAEESFQSALTLNPASAPAMLNVGIAKLQHKDHNEACEWFRKTIEQKPDSLQAYLKLGEALKKLNERRDAIAAFQGALRCQPLSATAHAELGALLLHDNQPQEALIHLQQAVDLNPSDAASEKLLREARKRIAK